MPIDLSKAMPNTGVMKAIERARDILGGTGALACALGVKPPTVSQWIKGDRPVPTDRCPAIEKATEGAVRCEDLRPDVDWAYVRANGAPASEARL